MKKLLSVVLLLVLCIGCFASCSMVEGWFGGNEEEPAGNIQGAADILESLVTKEQAEPVRNASFDVPTTVVLEEISYSVVWTVDDARIKITDGRKEGFKTIVIPDVNPTEFSFVLTAAITGAGQEKTISMRIKCPVKQDIGAAEGIEVNKPYLLAMEQINVEGKPTYYATGSMYQYWFALTTDKANGVNFYFEETTGGYYMYAKLGETKNYVNVVLDDTFVNCVYAAEAATVWTWDNTLKTAVTSLEGTTYLLGAKKTNKNLTPLAITEVEISYAKIVASTNADRNHFYVPSVEGAVKPVTGQKYTLTTNLDFDSIYYATGANATDKNGAAKDYWLAFDKDITKAANFYVEEVTDGYNLYAVVNGAKKYVNIIKDGKYISSKYQDTAASVWTWNETLSTLTVTIDSVEYVLATQGHQNLSAKTVAEASYCAQFVVSTIADQTGGSTGGEGGEGGNATLVPSDITSADAIKANTAYKFYLYQSKEGKNYYLAGGMSGYYMATTTDVSAAVDVYAEIVEGGFKLYYNDATNTKQYLAVEKSADGEHTNAVFNATGSVFTFNTEYKTFVTTLADGNYFLGTYDNYKTFGASAEEKLATSYAGHLATLVEDTTGGEGGEGGDTPITPDADIKVDTPYIIHSQNKNGDVYITGGVASGRLNGSATKADAITVYLEAGATAGQYYIYYLNGTAKQYIKASGNSSSGLAIATEKDDACLWTIDSTAKTIVSVAYPNRGIATQTTSDYTTFSFYAASNFTSTDYCVAWFVESTGTTPPSTDPDVPTITTSTIATVIAQADGTAVQIEGTVIAVASNQFIIKDATGMLLVYKAPGDLAVGDKITIKGEKASYNKCAQLPNKDTTTWTKTGTETVDLGTAATPTYAEIEAMKALAAITPTYVTITGTLAISGNYYNINFAEGTATIGSLQGVGGDLATALAALDGKKVTVTGFFINVSQKKIDGVKVDTYFNVLPTAAVAAPLTDAEKVAADKAALDIANLAATGAGTATLPETVADGKGCTITWAVDAADTAKATIAGATITFTSTKENTTVKVIATIKSGEATDTKEFTFNVTANESYTDAEKVALDKAALELTLAVNSSSTTTLPLVGGKGSAITYAILEADAAKATLEGASLKFAAATADTTVTVTATITSGEVTDTKEFVFAVTATDADKLAADKAALTASAANCGAANTLPTTAKNGSTIAWAIAAGDETGATLEGTTLTVPASTYNLYVKVVATLTLGTATDTKELTITATGNKAPAKDYTSNNFDDKTADSALEGMTAAVSGENGIVAGYETTEGSHGTVVSATFNEHWNSTLNLTKISTELASESKATAIELSYDIKIDFLGNSYASFFTSFGKAGAKLTRTGAYNNNGVLAFRDAENGWKWTNTNISFPSDWINIRTVIYAADPTHIYYYINGSETPIVQALKSAIDITTIEWCQIFIDTKNAGKEGTNLKLDNFFFGYIEPKVIKIDYRPEADNFDDKKASDTVEDIAFVTSAADVTFDSVVEYVETSDHGTVLSTTFKKANNFLSFNKINADVAKRFASNALEMSFDIKANSTGRFYIANRIVPISSFWGNRFYFGRNDVGNLVLFGQKSEETVDTGLTWLNNEWIHIRMVINQADYTKVNFYIDDIKTPFVLNVGSDYDITKVTSWDWGWSSSYSFAADTNIQIDNFFFGYIEPTSSLEEKYEEYVNDFSDAAVDGVEHSVDQNGIRDDASVTAGDTTFRSTSGTLKYEYITGDAAHGTVAAIDYSANPRVQFVPNYTLPNGTTATAYVTYFDIKLTNDGTVENSNAIAIRPTVTSSNTALHSSLPYLYLSHSKVGGGEKIAIGANDNVFKGIDPWDWMHVRMVVYASDLSKLHIYVNDMAYTTLAIDTTKFTSLSDITSAGFTFYSTGDSNGKINSMYIDNVFAGFTTDTLAD